MLWLVWHMWILIALAFAGGVIAGWVVRGRSDETPQRPMLERLDATVVTPVEDTAPANAAESEPEPDSSPEPALQLAPARDAELETPPAPAESEASTDEAIAADDLTAIKGLGPKAAAKLNAEGVTRYAEIASWTAADVARFDALINGRGRIERDAWVKQASALAKA